MAEELPASTARIFHEVLDLLVPDALKPRTEATHLVSSLVLHDGDHVLKLRPVLATEPYADLRRKGIVAQDNAGLVAISGTVIDTTGGIRPVDTLEVAGVLWWVCGHAVTWLSA